MMLFFVAGIYLFARGIFAWYGQPIFYRKGTLENIDPDHLPQYLREEGVWNFLTGLVGGKSHSGQSLSRQHDTVHCLYCVAIGVRGIFSQMQ